jgi:prepilin-type N-terminal cleavage/methylation domain-containing protein
MSSLALNKRTETEPQKGYSLVEMVVVVFIIVILFGLGIANYGNYSRREAYNNVLEQIVSDMRLTQEYALAGKKPSGCDVLNSYQFRRSNAHQYVIEADCSNSDYIVKTVNLATTLEINFINPHRPSPNHTVQFYVLGRGTNADSVSSANKIMKLGAVHTEHGFNKNVTVTLNGDIYIED